MTKKNITILGSTGTIGINTLDVLRNNKDKFKVYSLTVNKNIEVLYKQIEEFKPEVVVICDDKAYEEAKSKIGNTVKLIYGEEGLKEVSSAKKVDFVLAGIVGAAGLSPFLAALESGKQIGLANKEVLVMMGEYLHTKYNDKFLNQIIPVDSEHSAIFQCLNGNVSNEVESILLTASGGPFRNRPDLKGISVQDALKHPNWEMGNKITIDSATLMNKGLELIEAYWLFPVNIDQIQVIIHPQSIIHSMVSFVDGSILAHLGIADMRIPIQYALSYPERIPNSLKKLDFFSLKELTFEKPDYEKFTCLQLAIDALKIGKFAPAILNAVNEISVDNFLSEKIIFEDIAKCNKHVLNTVNITDNFTLENIKKADMLAREEAKKWILVNGI